MFGDDYRAALIDAYWVAVMHDPSTPPPPELDPAMADLVRRLATQARPSEPDERFIAELRCLLAEAAAARVTRPTLAAFQRKTLQPTWSWTVGGRFAAVIALLVAVWGVLVTIHSRPVQAEEIIQRVQTVSTAPAMNGIETMTLTQVTTYGIDYNVPDGQRPTDYRAHRTVYQVWYAAPYRLRVEERAIKVMPDGQELERWEIASVSDGLTHWWYNETSNTVRIEPAGAGSLTNIPFASVEFNNSPNRLLREQRPCMQPELRGKEDVVGREAYLIVFVRTCPVPDGPQSGMGEQQLWIDAERFVVLKEVQLNFDGSLWRAREITHIEYNTPIDPEQFTFVSPPGAHVVEPSIPVVGPESFRRQLVALARRAPFTIFAPRVLAGAYVPRQPALLDRLILIFALPEKATADRMPAQSTVTVYERAATDADARRWWPKRTEIVTISGVTAHYDPGITKTDGHIVNRSLSMIRDGVAIDIYSNALSREELIAFAESLELVDPRSSDSIPSDHAR